MADQTPDDLKQKFWKNLRKDMTVMLGLPGKVSARPMTAQLQDDEDRGPIWFFTSKDTEFAKALSGPTKAEMVFSSKGHDLFATVHGNVSPSNDRAVIDALWNRFVAAWFEGGKDDPKLQLVRFDATEAQIWADASSLVAGLKMMLGAGDPKEDYKDSVAEVRL